MTVLPPAGDPNGPPSDDDEPEVGSFRRGSEISRVALGRYLVARALTEALDRSLYAVALVLTLIAVASFVFWIKWIGVLIFIVALFVLGFRLLFLAVLRRLAGPLGVAEGRIRGLVADSRGDLRRELKRIGLPGSTLGLPLLALRLLGRRRKESFAKLGQFDIARVVPPSRLDELHMIIQSTGGTRR